MNIELSFVIIQVLFLVSCLEKTRHSLLMFTMTYNTNPSTTTVYGDPQSTYHSVQDESHRQQYLFALYQMIIPTLSGLNITWQEIMNRIAHIMDCSNPLSPSLRQLGDHSTMNLPIQTSEPSLITLTLAKKTTKKACLIGKLEDH